MRIASKSHRSRINTRSPCHLSRTTPQTFQLAPGQSPHRYACWCDALLATNAQRLLSASGSVSIVLPLTCVDAPSCSAMRAFPATVYAGQMGERASLCVLGSPLRTKESQHAMSSEANASSIGRCGWNVVVPLNLGTTSQLMKSYVAPRVPMKKSMLTLSTSHETSSSSQRRGRRCPCSRSGRADCSGT